MKIARIILLLSNIFLAACVAKSITYNGLEPIYPAPVHIESTIGGAPSVVIINSLTPVFEWKPSAEQDTTYDISIYDSFDWVVGQKIYYREGLAATKHQIEEMLLPHKYYFWSVRERHGDKVSPWSTHDYFGLGPSMSMRGNKHMYLFKTPNQEN